MNGVRSKLGGKKEMVQPGSRQSPAVKNLTRRGGAAEDVREPSGRPCNSGRLGIAGNVWELLGSVENILTPDGRFA